MCLKTIENSKICPYLGMPKRLKMAKVTRVPFDGHDLTSALFAQVTRVPVGKLRDLIAAG